MEDFVRLLQRYISHKISKEDLFTEYSILRDRVQNEETSHPLHKDIVAAHAAFLVGSINREEYKRQFETSYQKVGHDLKQRGILAPGTQEYDLLLNDLFFLIERLDGPEEIFREDVLSEEAFYQAVKELLDHLLDLK